MPIKALCINNYAKSKHAVRPEAEVLIGLQRSGIEIEVMTQADCFYARRMAEAGIRIHDFVPERKYSLAAIRAIRRVIRDGQHSILHLFNNKAIVNGLFAAWRLPVKVVTYRGQTGNISRWDPVCYLTHLSPRVDKIVCVSKAVEESLRAQVYDPGKLVTIYKGHDLAWYSGVAAADRRRLGIPEGAFLVTCVANYRPRKGVSVLVDAAATLSTRAPIHFAFVGRDMTSPDLKQQIARTAIRHNIHLFDHRDDVLEIVAASDISVLPATKREGLPKTVIESMALGVTPVVTATGGSPELVVDGESGLVVPPGDAGALAAAIQRLYAKPDLNRQLGRAARQRLGTHFRVEDSVAAHFELYRDLAESF